MTTGKIVFSLTVSAEALQKIAEEMRLVKAQIERAFPELRRQNKELRRASWWKRSRPPPEYIADATEPQWWNEGDEPPDWFAAV